MHLAYRLFQGDGLFRADLLAAETGDARIGIHLGKIVMQGQGRYRALIDAGGTPRAQLGIGLRPQERSFVKKGLHGLVLQDRFAA
jgi:hypothetical protein